MSGFSLQPCDSFTPNDGGQEAFWSDWSSRFVALEGGLGAGKTFIGSRKLLTLHLFNSFDENQRPTGVRSAVVAPTYDNLLDFDVPAILEAAEDFGLPRDWHGQRKTVVFPGTPLGPILARSSDKAQRIAGFEVGAFWGDEAARWKQAGNQPMNDPLVQIQGRLRDPAASLQQGIFTYSNEGDHTSIYEFFHSGNKDRKIYRATTYENADNVGTFIASQEASLTKELARQYLMGEAISLKGAAAYSPFDGNVHVDANIRLDTSLPLGIFMDFNISPGMYGGFCQHFAGQDLLTAVHEFHEPSLTVVGMVAKMADFIREEFKSWEAFPGIYIYGDPAGHARASSTGQSDYTILLQALEASGCPMDRVTQKTRRKHSPVVDRINAVNVAMLDMRGVSHTTVHPRCTRLIEDFKKVTRSKDGTGINKSNNQLTHASDAWGYFVEYERPIKLTHYDTTGARVVFGASR